MFDEKHCLSMDMVDGVIIAMMYAYNAAGNHAAGKKAKCKRTHDPRTPEVQCCYGSRTWTLHISNIDLGG